MPRKPKIPERPEEPKFLRNIFRKIDISPDTRPAIHIIDFLRRKIGKLKIPKEKKEKIYELVGKWVRSTAWLRARANRGIPAKQFLPILETAIKFLEDVHAHSENLMEKHIISHTLANLCNIEIKLRKQKPKYVYPESFGRKGFSVQDALLWKILELGALFYEAQIQELLPKDFDMMSLFAGLDREKHFVGAKIDAERVKAHLLFPDAYVIQLLGIEPFDPVQNEDVKRVIGELKTDLYKKSRFTFYDAEYIAKTLAPVLAEAIYQRLREGKVINSEKFRKKLKQMAVASALATFALRFGNISKVALEDIISTIRSHKAFDEALYFEKIEPLLKSKKQVFAVKGNKILKSLCNSASYLFSEIVNRYLPGWEIRLHEVFFYALGYIQANLFNRKL